MSFAYDGQRVLKEVSVDVRPHRSIAIVGASGAGKTTFANLAMRFLDPDAGTMRFSGTDLRGYAPDEYRQKLALIPKTATSSPGQSAIISRLLDPTPAMRRSGKLCVPHKSHPWSNRSAGWMRMSGTGEQPYLAVNVKE